jgi:hypothetical protein
MAHPPREPDRGDEEADDELREFALASSPRARTSRRNGWSSRADADQLGQHLARRPPRPITVCSFLALRRGAAARARSLGEVLAQALRDAIRTPPASRWRRRGEALRGRCSSSPSHNPARDPTFPPLEAWSRSVRDPEHVPAAHAAGSAGLTSVRVMRSARLRELFGLTPARNPSASSTSERCQAQTAAIAPGHPRISQEL